MNSLQKLEYNVKQRNKAIAVVTGLVILVLGNRAGVDAEQLTGAVALLVAYILGDAYQKRM
jgi:hypothetical protein